MGLSLILGLGLIAAGIISKRLFGHPEHMIFYHLPGFILLIYSGYLFKGRNRAKPRN